MEYKVIYDKKEINLNALLHFDLLKEVLYKLLLSQDNLEKEIDKLKKSNIKRDNEISKLKKILKDNFDYEEDFSQSLENSEYSQNEEEEEYDDQNEEKEEKKEEEENPDNMEQNEIKEEKKEINNEINNEINYNIKPKEEIYKGEAIQFDGEKKDIEIPINNEKLKSNIIEEKEVNVENKNNDINDINETDNKKEEEKKIEEDNKIETKENIDENNNIKEEIDNKQNNEQDINIPEQKKEDENKNEPIKTETKNVITENKKKEKKEKKEHKKKAIKPVEKSNIQKDENTSNQNNNIIQSNAAQIPPELISKMAKQIKDNKKQILELEKKLKKEIILKTDNLKADCSRIIKANNKDNQNKLNEMNEKFDEMMKLKDKLENQMEECVTKCSSIDIINMFKDSGDGTVDAAKVMVRALEEKVFKKIEFIDTRAKKEQNDNTDNKIQINNILRDIKDIEKNLKEINENLDKNNENIKNINNDIDERKNNINEIMENNKNLNKTIDKVKKEFDNNLKKKFNELQDKINDLKNNNNDQGSNELFKFGFGNKGVDEEIIQSIDKKIGDLRKKMNDLENTMKLKFRDLEEIQNESKNMKSILEKKITRNDLKELYNLHLSDVDEINDLKDNINLTFDDVRKIKESQTNVFQKLDNLNRNIALLQNVQKNGTISPAIINFDKYVEQQKFQDTIKPILSEIEKIYREIGSLGRSLSEVESYSKTLSKTERVNKLDDDLNNKINDLRVIFTRKFVDKAELARNMKQIEFQIKSLDFDNKRNDAETWLMAKQPVGCFNCASCEANIKNVNPQNEYLPWNKYPQQDKIYRMGKGFSHMLQMMTSEFVKSIGNAQKDNENESTARSNGINPNFVLDKNTFNKNDINLNINERKQSASVLKINNKEQINELALKKINNYNLYSSKGKGRMQLPRVLKFKKKLKLRNESGVPISDDEYSRRNDIMDKEDYQDKNSPKIMKIMKKKQYMKTEENVDLTDINNSKF